MPTDPAIQHPRAYYDAVADKGIRNEILCGQCEAAKLLVWAFNSAAVAEKIAWTTDYNASDEKAYRYQVRCDYFRTAVAHPKDLQHCGGFRKLDKPKQ